MIKDLIYNNVVYSQFSIDETGNIMNKKTNYIYIKNQLEVVVIILLLYL